MKMLAEKIINVLAQMNDYTAYKELQKVGYNPDDKAWSDIYSKYKDDERSVYTKTYIHYLCDTEVREQARKTTLKPSQKKRIKAIEKFLKNKDMDSRPVFQHYYEDGENIVYTNTHMLGVISKEDAQGINENLNLKNLEGGNFPDWRKVVPELVNNDHETATINYSDVLATHKENKANKAEYDIYIVVFNDNTIGGYNAEYLLHCFTVLGQDSITIERNKKTWVSSYRDENEIPQNLQPAKITAENTSSYFVVTPVRLPQETLKRYEQKSA
jgi:hypothetical protein